MAKKLNLPRAEFKPSSKEGVVYIEKISGGEKRRLYYIRYRHLGGTCPSGKPCKGHFEKAEKADTPAKAEAIRQDRIRGKELSNVERRKNQKAREEAERSAQEAEKNRWTFDRLWKIWQEDPENAGKRGTYKADLRYRKHLKDRVGDREPADLKPLDIDRLRLDLHKKYSRETTKSVIGLITRIARYGAAKELCPGLSFPIILRGKKLGKEPRAKRVPTDSQVSAYVKTCREWPDPQAGNLQLLIVLTGIRRGSAWNLRWEDLDLDGQPPTAILRDSKTGDVRIVLSREAVELLRSHPRPDRKNPHVFTGADETGRRSVSEIQRIPAKIRKAAGLPDDLDPCHSFRRLLATEIEREYGVATAMKLGGWKTSAMVLHYTAPTASVLGEAANSLGRKIMESITESGKEGKAEEGTA